MSYDERDAQEYYEEQLWDWTAEQVYADLDRERAACMARHPSSAPADLEDPDALPHWRIESAADVWALVGFLALMVALMGVWLGRLAGLW